MQRMPSARSLHDCAPLRILDAASGLRDPCNETEGRRLNFL